MGRSDDRRVACRFEIRGRVQGVGYRVWVRDIASARGLVGWVRNRFDGSVEAQICGEAASVESFEAAAHAGPPGARVTHVDATPVDVFDAPTGFEIRATA